MPKLTVDGYGTFEVAKGKRLVLALAEEAGVDQLHACGGNCRCTDHWAVRVGLPCVGDSKPRHKLFPSLVTILGFSLQVTELRGVVRLGIQTLTQVD